MFLQATTTTIINNKVTEKQVFSLWDVLFSGGIIGNTIMIAIFLLGILALYVFFERYFFIKRASKETPKDRKSTRLNSSHLKLSRMPSSA